MVDDVNELIAKAKKSFKFYIGAGDDPNSKLNKIPVGIDVLDRLLKGGLKRGGFHIFVGPYSTGKTFLGQQAIRNVQVLGGSTVYIDAERRYDPDWFALSGIDVSKLLIARPTFGEEAIDLVCFYLDKKVDFIFVDSMAALVPEAELLADSSDQFIGLQSRMFTTAFRSITPKNTNSVIVATNQLRQNIGSRFNPGILKKMPGGEAQYYFSSLIMEVTRKGWITEKGEEDSGEEKLSAKRRSVGFNISCFIEKCNYAPPFKSCEIPFSFMTGQLDNTAAVINLAVDLDIIKQTAAWYAYKDQKILGKQAVYDYFSKNTAELEELKKLIL